MLGGCRNIAVKNKIQRYKDTKIHTKNATIHCQNKIQIEMGDIATGFTKLTQTDALRLRD